MGEQGNQMGTTRALLKAISDDAFFESIAASTLRIANPIYKGLIETGTNADGRTIADPVDGIAFANDEANTSFAILVHHTVTARNRLRGKWLDETEGDLIKAHQVFESCGDILEGKVRRLVICCSEDPPSDLVADLHRAAKSLGIDLDLWSGTALAHVLDMTPDGQWVRLSKLSVPQQRLSFDLAAMMTRSMVEALRPPGDPAEYVYRDFLSILDERLSASSDLILVVGRSGVGKTVACYEFAKELMARGGLVVGLSEKLLSESETLEDALQRAIKAHAPSLSEPSMIKALSNLVPGTDCLVWIEDINRAASPVDLLRKLMTWIRSSTSEHAKGAVGKSRQGLTLICPIWPDHIGLLSNAEKLEVDARSVELEAYSRCEGTAAALKRSSLMGGNLTSLQAQDVVELLGHDPLLIGLVADWHQGKTDDVIGQYLTNEYKRLTIESDYFTTEFARVLNQVSRQMVVLKAISPTGEMALNWLAAEDRPILRYMLRHSLIVRIDADGHLRYRHDRVRDYLLSASLSECFSQGNIDTELLEDPFFARVIGAALLGAPSLADAISVVEAVNPLALFHAFGAAVRTNHSARKELFEVCENVLRHEGFAARPVAETYAIKRVLGELDGGDVRHLLEISPGPCFARQEGLARNGHIRYAAAVCAHARPGMTSPRRDRIVAHILAKYSDTLIADLAAFINDRTVKPELREGALFLAGELGHERLIEALKVRWQEMQRDEGRLESAMLFAAITCAAGRDSAFCSDILAAWAKFPENHDDKADVKSASDVARYGLKGGLNRHANDRVVTFLLEAADEYTNLKRAISSTLSAVDHPAAVLNTAAAVSEIDRQCRDNGKGWFNFWAGSFADCWGGGFLERGSRRMSQDARRALKGVWLDVANEPFYRRRSFELWAARLSPSDLAEIAVNQPQGLEDEALRARLRHGDKTAKSLLLERIRASGRKSYWLQYVRHVGSEGLEDLFWELLELRRQMKIDKPGPYSEFDANLAELIGDRDDPLSLRLISDHWDHLKSAPYFVHALLYLATPASLRMFKEAIGDVEDLEKFFEHVHWHIGIKYNRRTGLTRIAQAEALMQYWQHLSDATRDHLWEECNRLGWFDWRRRNLDPLMGTDFAHHRAFLDEEADFSSLDHSLGERQRHSVDGHYWSKHHLETGLTVTEVLDRAERFAAIRASESAYQFFASVISEHGTRSDIVRLQRSWAQAIPNHEAEAANATFNLRLRSLA